MEPGEPLVPSPAPEAPAGAGEAPAGAEGPPVMAGETTAAPGEVTVAVERSPDAAASAPAASPDTRQESPRSFSWRRILPWLGDATPTRGEPPSIWRWALLTLVLTFVGGAYGFVLAAVLGIATILAPTPRGYLRLAAGLLALVPVLLIARGLPPAFFVSPRFVEHNMLAHYLAGTALVVLILGVLRETRWQVRREPEWRADDAQTVTIETVTATEAVTTTEPASGVPEAGALPNTDSPEPRIDLLPDRPPPPRGLRGLARLALGRAVGFWPILTALVVVDVSLRYAAGGGASPDPISARIGTNLVSGIGFALPGPLGGFAPTGLRAPLVPLLLALSSTTWAPAFTLRGLWSLIGGGTVLATGVAGRRLFGRRGGLVAAALVALLPEFWMEDVRLESTPIAQLFVALLLMLLARGGDAGYRGTTAFGAGAVAGLLALARPEGFVLGVAVLLAWVLGRRDPQPSLSRRRWVGIAALAGMALVAGPWFLRNAGAFHEPVPVTETGRILAGANSSAAYGGPLTGSSDPGAAEAVEADVVTEPLGEGTIDRRLRGRAFSFAVHHPLGLVKALGVRALRTFDIWNPVNERDAHAARGLATGGWILQWLGFVALLVLAAVGYWRLWPERGGWAVPLFAAPGAALVVGLLTYGEPLARAAVDPALALAGAAVLSGMRPVPGPTRDVDAGGRRRFRRITGELGRGSRAAWRGVRSAGGGAESAVRLCGRWTWNATRRTGRWTRTTIRPGRRRAGRGRDPAQEQAARGPRRRRIFLRRRSRRSG